MKAQGATILLIEDSEECQLVVKKSLAKSGFQLHFATTLLEAEKAIATLGPRIDLVLLDLSLPDGDGLSILDQMQSDDSLAGIPIFLFTVKDELMSKVAAFSLGAEDYLIKPINPIELKARVEMRLRKKSAQRKHQATLIKGDLALKPSLMKAFIRQQGRETPVELTSKEFKILHFLAEHDGSVYSRTQIVETVWGKEVYVLDRTVDSHICSLRRKLRHLAPYIESIPGAGYRFQPQSGIKTQEVGFDLNP